MSSESARSKLQPRSAKALLDAAIAADLCRRSTLASVAAVARSFAAVARSPSRRHGLSGFVPRLGGAPTALATSRGIDNASTGRFARPRPAAHGISSPWRTRSEDRSCLLADGNRIPWRNRRRCECWYPAAGSRNVQRDAECGPVRKVHRDRRAVRCRRRARGARRAAWFIKVTSSSAKKTGGQCNGAVVQVDGKLSILA